MCGITGFTSFEFRISQETLVKMTATLKHRGPDDEGYYVSREIALGMRRLSIINLTPGIYPLRNERKDLFSILDGKIYNFREIRKELEKFGHQFKTNCDGEILIHAYEQWGINFFSHLNGMFAIALWDEKRKLLFLARDRLGIKPLYYTVVGDDLIFASEIKAILKHPAVKGKPNLRVFGSYFSFRYIVGKETFFKDIFSLSPGSYLIWQKGKINRRKYWDLPVVIDKEDKGENFYLGKTKLLIEESIKKRLAGNAPLSAFLSGGIDSAITVAVMSRLLNEPVKTFSIGFSEKGFNEFSYARQVVRKLKADHREIILKGVDYVNLMPKLIKFKDTPLSAPHEVPAYVLSKELKKFSSVVISGEGADELFGGYGRIFRSPIDYCRLRLIPRSLRKHLLSNLYQKYKNFNPQSKLDFFLHLYRYISLDEQKELFSPEVREIINNDEYGTRVFESCFQKTKNLSFYDQILYSFQKLHLLGLLHRMDTATMAASVEARVPFIDHKLIEFVNTIPFEYKIRWESFKNRLASLLLNCDQISEEHDIPKYLLKKIFEGELPKQVVWRKKVGFPVPLDAWFKGGFKNYARKVLLSKKCRQRGIFDLKNIEKMLKYESGKRFGYKVWMMINLELWFREYFG